MLLAKKPTRTMLVLASALSVLFSTAFVVAAREPGRATTEGSRLSWSLCRDLVKDWDLGDGRTECATLTVPLDYDHPQGAHLRLMISRIATTSPHRRRGVILINPGGPGNPGLTMPGVLDTSSVAEIGANYDLIGFDPRGTGLSEGKKCDLHSDDGADPDPKALPEQQFRQSYQQTARHNTRCVSYDPAFVSHLSTTVIARDLDRIRTALGEEKISFYGISWGTALGAVYRSLYDRHVDRMLLDSVMPPNFSMRAMNEGPVRAAEGNFERFTRWAAAQDSHFHLGSTPQSVRSTVVRLVRKIDAHPPLVQLPDGRTVTYDGGRLRVIMTYPQSQWQSMALSITALRGGGVPPLTGEEGADGAVRRNAGLQDSVEGSVFMQTSVLCNDQGPDADAGTLWEQEQQCSASSPLFSWMAGYQHWCAGWPLPAQPWNLRHGTSALQLVGHRYETVTPHRWAEAMRQRIGGGLLSVEDGAHGSLHHTPCGSEAVAFFSTGRPATGPCSPAGTL